VRQLTWRAAFFLGIVLGFAMAATGPASASVSAFPADQVVRGEEVWTSVCARCHAAGSDNPDAPKLLEPPPITSFATAAGMFQYVRESMPYDEPGTLTEDQYWAAVAYILTQKGVTGGDVPLGPENALGIPVKAP
jgi:S-disulfanyl-L-cysteine oxidoreductase SoxD